jgi:Peptidase family M23
MKNSKRFIIVEYIILVIIVAFTMPMPLTEARVMERKRKAVVQPYLPLQQMHSVPSTFGEHREDHFHAGIDFGTCMQIGEPVLAFDDGVIFRIRYQKRGYGKVLYLRHKKNIISVYAHLDRFENNILKLEDLLNEEQTKQNRKYVDMYFDQATITVKKHQVIAYSGETGEGLPHLHFELRKGEEAPMNPFNAYFKETYDHESPFLQGIILCPGDHDSSIEFSKECRTYTFIPNRGHTRFQMNTIPAIEGKFKLFVSLYDKSDDTYWRAPKYIWFYIDGKLAFKIANSVFTYADNANFGYLYDQGMQGPWEFNVPVALCNSHAKNLSMVTFFNKSLCSLQVTNGTHALKIVAADANMNISTALFYIAKIQDPAGIFSVDPETGTGCFAFKSLKRADSIVVPSLGSKEINIEYWDLEEQGFKTVVPAFVRRKCGLQFSIPMITKGSYYVRLSFSSGKRRSPWLIAYDMSKSLQSMVQAGAGSTVQAPGTAATPQNGNQFEWKFEYGADYLFMKAIPSKDKPVFFTGTCSAPGGKEQTLEFRYAGMEGIFSVLQPDVLSGPMQCSINELVSQQKWSFSFDINYMNNNVDSVLRWGTISISVPAGSAGDSGYVWLEKIQPRKESFTLPFLSDLLQFHPRGMPFTKRALVKVVVPDVVKDSSKAALYRWQRKKKEWKLILSHFNTADRTVEGYINYFDRIAVIYDNVGPSFTAMVPNEGEVLSEQPKKFIVGAKDEGMGIDDDNLFFILDYERIPAEYDPDRDIAYFIVPRKLNPGTHTLKVIGRDWAMNDASPLIITFRIKQ